MNWWRILRYRWRNGEWCAHDDEDGQLVEFIEDGRTIDLISIGIVDERGREYYAVASDAPWDRVKRHPWLMRNVVPSLPGSRPDTPIGVPRDQPEDAKPGQEWYWQLDLTATCVKPRQVIANEVRGFLLGTRLPGGAGCRVGTGA